MTQDPTSWFGGVRRPLFVHAHPDDETIATGGTLAALAAAGREPVVITLTRGEQGEMLPGGRQHGDDPDIAGTRMRELAGALDALGVTRHEFLGSGAACAQASTPRRYEDSGMVWAPDGWAVAAPGASAEALTRAAVSEVLADLIAAVAATGAEAIISYDHRGGYGHPDHVRAHQVARAVAVGLELPFWEIVAAHGAQGADGAAREYDESGSVRADSVEYDVSAWHEHKMRALQHYRSQLVLVSDCEIEHVGGQRQQMERTERFRLLAHP